MKTTQEWLVGGVVDEVVEEFVDSGISIENDINPYLSLIPYKITQLSI